MSVFNIKEIIKFRPSDIKKMGEELTKTHKFQAQDGIDADGKRFPSYTPRYARRKAAGKAAKNQISKQTNPVNLTLTGAMWKEFKYQRYAVVDSEIHIDYGIKDAEQAKKMVALQKGRFGKPSKKSRITNRKDKARVVAKNQKVGPEVEDRIALLFARNIEKNLKRLTNRPTIIRM